jgi:hypothetical protein
VTRSQRLEYSLTSAALDKLKDEDTNTEGIRGVLPGSSADHRRRVPVLEREIELLKSLANSDDAVYKLKELWLTEKEPYVNPMMLHRSTSQSLGYMSKGQLQRQIRQHPKWTEPRMTLAQMYYKEQRTLLAFEQCLEVLELKPWHFEMNDLLVKLSLQRQNMGMALTWARLRLPELRKDRDKKENWRRQAWVDRAVAQAVEKLEELENERVRSMMKTAGLVISADAFGLNNSF